MDVEFMKALHEKVNIVPLIAKADCLIPSEIRKLKERVSCSFFTELYLMQWQGWAEEGGEIDICVFMCLYSVFVCL